MPYTDDSLRRYLVEETYELLEAIEDGDRAALREELGDVLLQVLFHARVAAEYPVSPFGVDEVAAELVGKLVGRHPHAFADGDPSVRDAATQQHRWEELKQAEKQRRSSVDGVALGQPAAGLAGKLTQRAIRSGLPADLLPGNELRPRRRTVRASRGRGTGRPGTGDRTRRAAARLFAGRPARRRTGGYRSRAQPARHGQRHLAQVLARITFAHRLRQLSTGSRRPARSPPKSTRMDLGGRPEGMGLAFYNP